MKLALRLSAILLIVAAGARTAAAQTNVLTINPSTVIFCGQPGQVVSSVPVSISTSAGSVMFIPTSVTSDGNWLAVEPAFATATTYPYPQLMLELNGGVIPLATGTYNGQVVLGSFDGAKLATIPVSLQVSREGCGATKTGSMFVKAGALTYELPPNVMTSHLLNVYNTFPIDVIIVPDFTTNAPQNWISLIHQNLSAVSGILYPAPLGIDISTVGLSAGPYTGNIELDGSNDSILNIPVAMTVNPALGSAQFAVSPSPLSIGIPNGTTATSADIQLTNLTKSAFSISTSAASDRNWLSVSPASVLIQANATISLTATITGTGLVKGPNKGNINVQLTSGSSASFAIPVTANFGINSEISAAPNPVNITTPPGANTPVTQTLSVSTNAGLVSLTATAFSSVNQAWLSVTPFNPIVSPDMPVNVTVSVQPSLLPAGPAIGVITLKPVDGSLPLIIPVNVNAGPDPSLTVAPGQLSFAYQAGGAPPQTQSLSLTSTFPNNYSIQATTASGGNWLIVSSQSVAAPAALTAQVNPSGLAPNIYKGQIAITNMSSGGRQIVPVTLTVGQPLSISANPAALTFNYQVGASPMPQAQSVQLASTGGSAIFVATASGLNGGPNFLTVNPSSNSTPATLAVGLNASVLATLPAGQYSAIVTVSSAGLPSGSQMVSVTLVISPMAPQPLSIVSSASLQPGPVSPGELVTIFGMNLGPTEGVAFSLTAQGAVPTQLGGVTLTFDDNPAPLLYVGAGQINAIVPYEIGGRTQTSMIIARNGAASTPLPLQVAGTVPAIFSATQNGNGQGAILNADSSYNGANNPAAQGSVIQIFATGEGGFPGAITGSVTPVKSPLALFPTPVSVTIGGQPAQIQFIGEAPGLLSGILQVNAVVPANIGSGPQQVVLSVGGNSNSQQSISVIVGGPL